VTSAAISLSFKGLYADDMRLRNTAKRFS